MSAKVRIGGNASKIDRRWRLWKAEKESVVELRKAVKPTLKIQVHKAPVRSRSSGRVAT